MIEVYYCMRCHSREIEYLNWRMGDRYCGACAVAVRKEAVPVDHSLEVIEGWVKRSPEYQKHYGKGEVNPQ